MLQHRLIDEIQFIQFTMSSHDVIGQISVDGWLRYQRMTTVVAPQLSSKIRELERQDLLPSKALLKIQKPVARDSHHSSLKFIHEEAHGFEIFLGLLDSIYGVHALHALHSPSTALHQHPRHCFVLLLEFTDHCRSNTRRIHLIRSITNRLAEAIYLALPHLR